MLGWARKNSKIPTESDVAAFDGMHCATLYRLAVRDNWRCPCCDRTAIELIRWTYINGSWYRRKYGDEHGMAFSVGFARHHCHSERCLRFPTALICCDCNAADGTAKRKLKLPKTWSFSPAEIKQFVTCQPFSGRSVIDYDRARQIFLIAQGGVFV